MKTFLMIFSLIVLPCFVYAETETLKVELKGMFCNSCSDQVTEHFNEMPQVAEVISVNHDNGEALIKLAEGTGLNQKEIQAAFEETHFEIISVAKEQSPPGHEVN